MGCFTECTSGIAKYTLFLLNLLIFVAAILLVAFGIKYKTDNAGIEVMSVSSFAIAVGVFIGLIAFFGCCGAVKESPFLLTTYAVILIILFVLQIILGALAFVAIKNKDTDLNDEVSKNLLKLYQDYPNSKDDRQVIDAMQQSLQCCILKNHNELLTPSNGAITSCCNKNKYNGCSLENKFEETCDSAMTDFIEENIKLIGSIAIGFSVVELVAALFACYVKSTR